MPNVEVSTVAGLQVPAIGVVLEEIKGKTGAGAPWQTTAGIPENVGLTNGVTVTGTVVGKAQGNNIGSGVNT